MSNDNHHTPATLESIRAHFIPAISGEFACLWVDLLRGNKIQVIKNVRYLTDCGLHEAQEFVNQLCEDLGVPATSNNNCDCVRLRNELNYSKEQCKALKEDVEYHRDCGKKLHDRLRELESQVEDLQDDIRTYEVKKDAYQTVLKDVLDG